MKKFSLIIILVTVFSFISCTDNEEIVTDNGEITNQQGIDKGKDRTINGTGTDIGDNSEE